MMNTYLIQDLTFPWKANPRHGDLTLAEQKRRGYRVLGGNRGDLWFDGYVVDETGTELASARLRTSLDLTPEEAHEIAVEVVEEAYESVGEECVEHS